MNSKTSAFSERIGDLQLALGLKRWSDSDGNGLWQLVVSKSPGAEAITVHMVTQRELTQLKLFCEKALETIRDDGGRLDIKQ